ncbi:hypothetical protein A2U01_0086258, partial [Trifolium medium]|nr:hypothetical protein [Trifolium medium]
MVLQHERQGNFTPSEDSKVLVNGADSYRSKGFTSSSSKGHVHGANPKGTNRVCTFCGKSNHIVDNYYAKHGFPP